MAFQQFYGPNTKATPGFQPLNGPGIPLVVTPPPAPSLASQAVTFAKGYAQKMADTVPAFGQTVINTVQHPLQSVVDLGNFVSAPAKQAFLGAADAGGSLIADKGASNKIAATANLISQFAGIGFSPVTASFDVAQKIPGAQQAADALNLPFLALGKAGEWASGGIVDHLPIPQASKDIIKAPIQGLGALALQVIFGGKVMDRIGALSKQGVEITPEVATKIVDEVKAEIPSSEKATPGFQPLKTPEEVHAEYAKSQGYEPYTPHEDLPTIDAGSIPKDKSGLPVIQTEVPQSKSEFKYEPIKETPIAPPVSDKATVEPISSTAEKGIENVPVETPAAFESKATAPEGTTPSGLAQSIERKAVAAGITKGFDKIAGYEGSTIAEQTRLFTEDFVAHGEEGLRDLLTGKRELPTGLKESSVVDAAEKYLKQKPNADLAYELANSPLVSKVSEAGSILGLLQNREQDSFTAKVSAIKKAREARAGEPAAKRGKSVPKEAKKAMNEVNLSSEDLGKLSDFIDKITC